MAFEDDVKETSSLQSSVTSNLSASKDSTIDDSLTAIVTHPGSVKRKRAPIPRLCKNDVRRLYGTMLARLINGADPNISHNFIRTFTRDTAQTLMCKFRDDVVGDISPKAMSPLLRILSQGASIPIEEWLKQQHFLTLRMFPDQIFRVIREQVIRKERNRRSTVILDVEIESSLVLDIDVVSIMEEMHRKQRLAMRARLQKCLPEPPIYSADTPIEVNNQVFFTGILGHEPKLRAKPLNLRHTSRILLHLDENKFIQSMESGDGLPCPYMLPALQRARQQQQLLLSQAAGQPHHMQEQHHQARKSTRPLPQHHW